MYQFSVKVVIPILICNLSAFGSVNSQNWVKVTEVNIPEYAVAGTDVKFNCQFRILGQSHKLYSVNWWRGQEQFFQYIEADPEPKSTHNFIGITVSSEESSKEFVVLKNVNETTSGEYKCEIMGEGPAFKTAIGKGTMNIIVPPKNMTIEQIGVIKEKEYGLGEKIIMRCTVTGMKPVPKINWLINGKNVKEPALRGRVNVTVNVTDASKFAGKRNIRQIIVFSSIQFRAGHLFEKKEATVTCMASVPGKNFTEDANIYLNSFAAAQLQSNSDQPRTSVHMIHVDILTSITTCGIYNSSIMSENEAIIFPNISKGHHPEYRSKPHSKYI